MIASAPKPTPLRIDEIVTLPFEGIMGLTLCPGHSGRPDLVNRNLTSDIQAIKQWGAVAVVTLMEDHEFSAISVPELPTTMQSLDIPWHHHPIRDMSAPDCKFERSWFAAELEITALLKCGAKILIHCRGGLGRSGVVAARILIGIGYAPDQAIEKVRACRPGAIETASQESYVLSLGSK